MALDLRRGRHRVFFATLAWLTPGFVERVWNLDALTGIRLLGIPLEELLFAAALGACWAGLYEHVHWLRVTHTPARRAA